MSFCACPRENRRPAGRAPTSLPPWVAVGAGRHVPRQVADVELGRGHVDDAACEQAKRVESAADIANQQGGRAQQNEGQIEAESKQRVAYISGARQLRVGA